MAQTMPTTGVACFSTKCTALLLLQLLKLAVTWCPLLFVAWFVISIVDGIFDTILYRLGRRYQLAVVSTDP